MLGKTEAMTNTGSKITASNIWAKYQQAPPHKI